MADMTHGDMDPVTLWKRFHEGEWEQEVPEDEPDCFRVTALYTFLDSFVNLVMQMNHRLQKLEKKKGGTKGCPKQKAK